MKISVKVIPGSSQDVITGWLGENLKIKVKAPAEGGKANQSVVAILASVLKLSRKDIVIISGKVSSQKIVEIKNLSDADIRNRLAPS